MANSLLSQATDPHQYDREEANWAEEGGKGLLDPHRRHFLHYVEQVVDSWQGKRFLDIGAGSGWLMQYALQHCAQYARGFDPAQNNVTLAKKLYGLDVVNAAIEDFTPGDGELFDLATAIFVLTHVRDLDLAFERISGWLAPGGRFVTIVPDFEYARRSRADSAIQIEDFDVEPYPAYVIRIDRGKSTISDIVRDVRTYKHFAEKHGLREVEQVEMKVTQILLDAYERYIPLHRGNKTIAQLLAYRKD